MVLMFFLVYPEPVEGAKKEQYRILMLQRFFIIYNKYIAFILWENL
jgi:hypothetical protein